MTTFKTFFGSAVFFFSLLAFIGCKNSTSPDGKAFQDATITYAINYPDNNSINEAVKPFLPAFLYTSIKGNKICYSVSMGMGLKTVLGILDYDAHTFNSVFQSSIGDDFATLHSEEEITDLENNPSYNITLTDERKVIAGLNCNKAIVKDETNNAEFEIYYYDSIQVQNWASPLKDLNKLLMDYYFNIGDFKMHLTAIEVDYSPVDASVFVVDPAVKWVTPEEYKEKLMKLSRQLL